MPFQSLKAAFNAFSQKNYCMKDYQLLIFFWLSILTEVVFRLCKIDKQQEKRAVYSLRSTHNGCFEYISHNHCGPLPRTTSIFSQHSKPLMDFDEQVYAIFNSEGRILQVEYGLEAVYSSYQTVTINAGDAVIAISKRLPTPKLCAEKHSSVYRISSNVYMNITGLPSDVCYVVRRARELAADIEYRLGGRLTPDIFARELAGRFQSFVLQTGRRAPAFAACIFGFEGDRALLHYVDMSGVEYPCHAWACGEDFGKMNKFLDKHMGAAPLSDLLELGVTALLESTGRDVDYSEVELSVLRKDGLEAVADNEVDKLLQAVAEKQ
ncbi:20S proteasome subunit alpha 1 [Pancytospora philotis]|nr:20S proteasome subunit alpha 1 [Pancytospora philotis]